MRSEVVLTLWALAFASHCTSGIAVDLPPTSAAQACDAEGDDDDVCSHTMSLLQKSVTKLKNVEQVTTEEEPPISAKKAVLSDLYLRKLSPKYPQPTGGDLICTSRHHRNDPDPTKAGDNRVDSNVRNVESDLEGVGVWRRYGNGGKPWRHARISSAGQARGLMEMARDGKKPNDGVMKHEPMSSTYKSRLSTAVSSIKSKGVNSCAHDNWISVPVGEANANVFSPGLNQLWITYDPDRQGIYGHVVVGAKADDSSIAYYIGAKQDQGTVSTMSFAFTTFSSPSNPITFTVGVNTGNGFPTLTMDIKHASGNQKYIRVVFSCRTVGSYSNGSDFVHKWKTRWNWAYWGYHHVMMEFGLFLDKGSQIYDICHCYYQTNSEVVKCVTMDGSTSMWDSIVGEIVSFVRDVFLKSQSELWDTRPRVTYTNGATNYCWNHFKAFLETSDDKETVLKASKVKKRRYSDAVGDDMTCDFNYMSKVMGEGSEWGSWCQETCVQPNSDIAKVTDLADMDCSQQGFTEFKHSVVAKINVQADQADIQHEPTCVSCLNAADYTPVDGAHLCNEHNIISGSGTFCQSLCLGRGSEGGYNNAMRMENHGMTPGACAGGFTKYIGYHDFKIYGPAGAK